MRETARWSARWVTLLATGLAISLLACSLQQDAASVSAAEIETPSDLARVAGTILDNPERLDRATRLVALLRALPDDRYSELARIVESRAVIPRHEDIGLIMHAWARRNPEEALAQALDWNRSRMPWTDPIPDYAVAEVIYAWSQDPGADVEGAMANAPEDLRPVLSVAMVRGWSESGQIARAARLIAQEPSGFAQILVTVLAERLAQDQGIEAAIEWAETLPDSPLRVNAFRRTAEVVARLDAQRATAWVDEHVREPHGSGMARRVAREWARREDPRLVLQWVDSIPDEDERRDAIIWVFQDWHPREAQNAMTWVQQREPLETMFRPILRTQVARLLSESPSEALAWIGEVVDEDRRKEAELALALQWVEKDEVAAQEWIHAQGLEEAVERNRHAQNERKRRPRSPARRPSEVDSSPSP